MKSTLIVIAGLAVACGHKVSGTTNDGDSDRQSGDQANPGDNDIASCSMFPANHIFNTRIDDVTKFPVDPHSDDYKTTIGTGIHLHADFGAAATHYGIPYNVVSGNALTWTHVIIDNNGTDDDGDESDCARDDDPAHAIVRPCTGTSEAHAVFPIPASPQVEGYDISTSPADSNGDAHMLLLDSDACTLWEVGQTRHASDGWHSAWDAAWDLTSDALRPTTWTSSDAAGFPILPLLAKADEAGSGTITHAFRYTIATTKIRTSYVWPARHLTRNGDASLTKPPMGQLFRLKASVATPSGASTRAQAVITALKHYGMYLADGGSDWYMTGVSDDGWDDATISTIQTLTVDDFEAVDLSGLANNPSFDPDSGAVP